MPIDTDIKNISSIVRGRATKGASFEELSLSYNERADSGQEWRAWAKCTENGDREVVEEWEAFGSTAAAAVLALATLVGT